MITSDEGETAAPGHSRPVALAKSNFIGFPYDSIFFEQGDAVALDIYRGGQLIGSIVRASGGVVYVYDAAGLPIGTFGNMDAATTALERRAAA